MLSLITVLAASVSSIAMSSNPDKKAVILEKSAGWDKLDLGMRRKWNEARRTKHYDSMVECIMKMDEKPNKKEVVLLRKNGFHVGMTVGKIITGNIRMKNLPSVANIPFVEAIEASVPMHLNAKDSRSKNRGK